MDLIKKLPGVLQKIISSHGLNDSTGVEENLMSYMNTQNSIGYHSSQSIYPHSRNHSYPDKQAGYSPGSNLQILHQVLNLIKQLLQQLVQQYNNTAGGPGATGGSGATNGNAGADSIRGGPGEDEIDGGEDGDTIWGEESDDPMLEGRQGEDFIYGSLGNDTLSLTVVQVPMIFTFSRGITLSLILARAMEQMMLLIPFIRLVVQ